MHAKNKHISPLGSTGHFGHQLPNLTSILYFAGRVLIVFGIALALAMASIGQVRADDQQDFNRAEKLDSRWLPWIGSWHLLSDAVDTTEESRSNNFTLAITPGDNRRSVAMRGSQDEAILLDKQIEVDGSRHALKQEDCEGWYTYSWSDTGKRLLFDSELACSDDRSRTISGISLFIDPIEWVDIQLLISGEDRAITIRRYLEAGGQRNLPGTRGAAHIARTTAGSNFSIEELIELCNKVAPQVMEAALVEMHKPFDINSKTLVRLSDAGVPSQVLDLVVALSFPERFRVERYDSEPVQRADTGRTDSNGVYCHACAPFGVWSFYDPYFQWYWRSPGWFYGYWGWGGWPGYYPPIWAPPGQGGAYRISGGRLIAGQGYAKVSPGGPNSAPRYAQPSRSNSRAYGSNSNSTASTVSKSTGKANSGSRSSSGRSATSRSSGSGGSGSSRGYSGGGSSRASPGGYSGGGSRQARPRD